MSDSKPSELAIPTEAIPTLKAVADALSIRLGQPLNYAQTYIVMRSAQASGAFDAIGCRDFLEHMQDPRLIEMVAALLEQHPELIAELQSKAKLQGFE
ncbi:hypothetical protein ACERK3_18205 [Phycisphaerales bacterium AB-hyl4]|uniref:Uncharacterized protein n=1 Tax=Natronomicrosphaera hydrolytica TaxID=3242702 RepID=A0ABV4U9D0_9BACT